MPKRYLRIEVKHQRLICFDAEKALATYPVSTGEQGAGEQRDSGCTPRGKHRIRLKIGEGCSRDTVFVARRPTGEIFSEVLVEKNPDRDWILTRILWLTGIESGVNRGGQVDTLKRYVYIHGTPEEHLIGKPVSHGCIRMRNRDLIELFDWTENGMLVEIVE
ncbi:MAG: L,D-transpeptidase [Candidatus Thiodiazotropha sp. (ex Semelilucina semeliformis)]|nr:L,D-transpeptidase [Candidatus Thiodiazotropha sp. (ex Semelilucina semeliformis)]